MFNNFIEWLGDNLSAMGETIVNVLPKSPFVYLEMIPEVNEVVGIVNYFIPITSMLAILQVWLLAVAGWHISMILMRWANIVS